jgi:hypothetical protein
MKHEYVPGEYQANGVGISGQLTTPPVACSGIRPVNSSGTEGGVYRIGNLSIERHEGVRLRLDAVLSAAGLRHVSSEDKESVKPTYGT